MTKTSFTATEQECLDLIQRLNKELGYPRNTMVGAVDLFLALEFLPHIKDR